MGTEGSQNMYGTGYGGGKLSQDRVGEGVVSGWREEIGGRDRRKWGD